ncbi:HDIG domain-containing metalloprotein, partial [Thermoproteota archaeon]
MTNMNIPNREKLVNYLKETGNSQRLIDHSNMVADLCLRIADIVIKKGIKVDKKILEAGAILHDISFDKHHGPDHGMIGHDMILELGLPEAVARLAEIHEPWSENETRMLKIPEKYCRDHFPINWEEKIFIAADSIPFLDIYSGIDPWINDRDELIDAALPFFNDDYFMPITGKEITKDHPFLRRWIRATKEVLE